jgi:hypothetical protein
MNTRTLHKLLSRIHQAGYKRIAFLFLLLSWAIFTYSSGNGLLGTLILVFVFLIPFRVPYSIPVTALVLVLVLFQTPIVKTGSAIVEANTSILENPGQALNYLFTPASGQAGLPAQARRALSLLQEHNIDRFQMSNRVLDDPLISQRITEMAWPRKTNASSRYLIFFLNEEKDYPACTIVDSKKDVALEYCH